MEDKQMLIDLLAYPPTHTYILDDLKPTGILQERFGVINRLAPDFFIRKKRFLDVGCNKGFFSLYGSQCFDEVVGIDNSPEFIELCTKLKRPNTEFILTDFRDYTPEKRFDRILLGNVHHYLFRSCGGWEWLYKLAAISKGLVIIEGPVDMSCPDMPNVFSGDIREHFNYGEFIEIMSRFFVLRAKIPTVAYTPGKYVMVFERKPDWTENIFELSNLPVIETFKENRFTKVFATKDNLVSKIILFYEKDIFSRINMARMSPISNDIVGAVHSNGKWTGWLEQKLAGRLFQQHENEIELFKLHCRNQVFLARNGYLDFDVTPINFLKEEKSGKIVWFDKNQVNPISKLEPRLYDLEIGWYFKYLKNGFERIYAKTEILRLLSKAMATMNSVKIEQAYKSVLEVLDGEPLWKTNPIF